MSETVPIPDSITDRVRNLKPGQSVFFGYADGISARAIASRLTDDPRPRYKTKREGQGIRLWRTK